MCFEFIRFFQIRNQEGSTSVSFRWLVATTLVFCFMGVCPRCNFCDGRSPLFHIRATNDIAISSKNRRCLIVSLLVSCTLVVNDLVCF